MEHHKEDHHGKGKTVITTLYGILLWVTKLSPPKNLSPQHLGLRAVIHSAAQNLNRTILHSYMVSSLLPSLAPVPEPSWTSVMGDILGAENGTYMSLSDDFFTRTEAETDGGIQRKQKKRVFGAKIYPPPIPLLSRAGNVPGMFPWVLTRQNVDGKLILTEQKAMYNEYLETHREDGRLTMNLIPLEDETDEAFELENIEFDKEGINETDEEEDENIDEDDIEEEFTVSFASSMPIESGWKEREVLGLRKCLMTRISSDHHSFFDMVQYSSSAPISSGLIMATPATCDVA